MLENERLAINQIDQQLMHLLEERFKLTEKIGQIKRQNGLPVYDATREAAIFQKIDDESFQYQDEIKKVYQAIMTISKEQQKEG